MVFLAFNGMNKLRVKFILSFAFLVYLFPALSQNVSFVARGNLSASGDTHTLDFGGRDLIYSPGAGIGLEIGLQIEIFEDFTLQSTLGHQLSLNLQTESFNGVSNESSYVFNRSFISFGAGKYFVLGENVFNGIFLEGGVQYHLPGSLKRTENDIDLGTSKYDPNLGYYLGAGARLKLKSELFLDPGIRFRSLELTAKSYTDGPIEVLPTYLQTLNVNGLELAVSLVKKF